jgi:hypothetical protein
MPRCARHPDAVLRTSGSPFPKRRQSRSLRVVSFSGRPLFPTLEIFLCECFSSPPVQLHEPALLLPSSLRRKPTDSLKNSIATTSILSLNGHSPRP